MPTPPDAPTRLIGGRYRLDRSIGQGGMGTVWQGHDELLGREVAVKEVRFPPELGKQEMADLRERTMREARATARLSHPNVITTYDVVEEDGRPWIVMELLATRTLSELLRDDGPLPPHRVAEIGLGTTARADLLVDDEPMLEVLDFSAPNVEPLSGDFGMEIRVGYETGKGGRRAISGGSVTGNLFEAMANARFSAESAAFAQYAGPASIRFESLQVAGEG